MYLFEKLNDYAHARSLIQPEQAAEVIRAVVEQNTKIIEANVRLIESLVNPPHLAPLIANATKGDL